jgi:hypothetical protein
MPSKVYLEEMRNAYKMLVKKPEGQRPCQRLGIDKKKYKTNLKEIRE